MVNIRAMKSEALHVQTPRRKPMKNLVNVLCSIFFATTLSLPAEALANPVEDLNDTIDEQVVEHSAADCYHLALLTGDFGLQLVKTGSTYNSGPPIVFTSDPTGKIVKDAQVITTIIASSGDQIMLRAWPFKCGYLVATNHLSPGRYRVEAEIVTEGRILTDEFSFIKA